MTAMTVAIVSPPPLLACVPQPRPTLTVVAPVRDDDSVNARMLRRLRSLAASHDRAATAYSNAARRHSSARKWGWAGESRARATTEIHAAEQIRRVIAAESTPAEHPAT